MMKTDWLIVRSLVKFVDEAMSHVFRPPIQLPTVDNDRTLKETPNNWKGFVLIQFQADKSFDLALWYCLKPLPRDIDAPPSANRPVVDGGG